MRKLILLGLVALATTALAVPLKRVIVLLHLHHLQGFRVELGLEVAALGVGAAKLVAAVVDLQSPDLPALTDRHLPHRRK